MTLGSAGSVTPSDLRGLTRFLTKTNANSFSDTIIDALLNLALHRYINIIVEVFPKFNIESDTQTLTAGTRTYTIPSSGKFLKVEQIQISYDGVTFHTLTEMQKKQFPHVDFSADQADNHFSQNSPYGFIYVISNVWKVDLYPKLIAGSDNVANGFAADMIKEVAELSGTTDEPGIAEEFQQGLSFETAKMYFLEKRDQAGITDMNLELHGGIRKDTKEEVIGIIPRMTDHYAALNSSAPIQAMSDSMDYS